METIYGIAQHYTVQIGLIILCYIASVFAVLMDLRSGISKAKLRGEYRSSFKIRKTCQKFNEYGNTLVILTLVDILVMAFENVIMSQMSWTLPILPIFSFFGAIGICYIEYKSIKEKAEDKHKFDDAEAFLLKLAKDKSALNMIYNLIERRKPYDDERIEE